LKLRIDKNVNKDKIFKLLLTKIPEINTGKNEDYEKLGLIKLSDVQQDNE
jgi:hypothetical protein